MNVELEIAGSLGAPASARRAVEGLAAELPSGILDDLRLLVSELVTNSVRHAGLSPGEAVHLRITSSRKLVRVEVADAGTGFSPQVREQRSATQVSGWGLYLVDRIADRWGVSGDGTTLVWFEIDRAPRAG